MEYKFDQQELINYLITNSIVSKARIKALELCFLGYIATNNPEKLDSFEKAYHNQYDKEIQIILEELALMDINLADLLKRELLDDDS